jgi:predicted permease
MPQTYWAESAVDARVVLFIGAIAIGTGVLAGLAPALQASRPEVTEALKGGTRGGGSGARRSRLRQLLLVAQVAMSVLLLYGAGLFVHSLLRLRGMDLGFDADRIVYGAVYLVNPQGNYLDWGQSGSTRVKRGLMATAQQLGGSPGVEQVALSSGGPMGGYAMIGLYMQDGSHVPRLDARDAAWNAASPSYFAVTGSRLVRGRLFTDVDRSDQAVIVVNETAARTYWPGGEALGQCLRLFSTTAPCATVIGIVRDSHVEDVVEKPVLQLISPFTTDSLGLPRGVSAVIVRAAPGQTAHVKAALRRALTRQFPTLAVPYVRSVQESMATELRPWRVGLMLFGGFGILALIVAALGTYSVLSYAVTQRMHEIGVRVALGARGADVVRLVVGQGVRVAAIGVAVGLAMALAVSRVMQSLLYETSPREPMVTVGVAALLIAVAAAASAVPARRAARVDPVGVLRAE